MANNYEAVFRHAGEAGIYDCTGFRGALANASSPGMTMHFLAIWFRTMGQVFARGYFQLHRR